jgi:hypothetical protein
LPASQQRLHGSNIHPAIGKGAGGVNDARDTSGGALYARRIGQVADGDVRSGRRFVN